MKSKIHEVLNLNNIKLSKKLKLITGAFIFLFTLQSSAQVSVSLNIGSRPDWSRHYDNDDDCDHNDHCSHNNVEYFYLPEIEAYYDVRSSVFIYLGPRGWIRSPYLPDYCHGYDLHRGHKVAIDYHGHSPYAYHNHHRTKYYRSGYRNYRQEYYHPRHERRSNHIAMTSPRDHHGNGGHHHKAEKRDNNHRNQGNGHRNENGNGNGNGRGNGRR